MHTHLFSRFLPATVYNYYFKATLRIFPSQFVSNQASNIEAPKSYSIPLNKVPATKCPSDIEFAENFLPFSYCHTEKFFLSLGAGDQPFSRDCWLPGASKLLDRTFCGKCYIMPQRPFPFRACVYFPEELLTTPPPLQNLSFLLGSSTWSKYLYTSLVT